MLIVIALTFNACGKIKIDQREIPIWYLDRDGQTFIGPFITDTSCDLIANQLKKLPQQTIDVSQFENTEYYDILVRASQELQGHTYNCVKNPVVLIKGNE